MIAATRSATREDFIRSMIQRAPHSYINEMSSNGRTAAMYARTYRKATQLELLLTLGADPRGCRGHTRSQGLFQGIAFNEAIHTVLYRFEQRATLACCLRHYDELHQAHAINFHHPVIVGLLKDARNVRDLHPDVMLVCRTFIRSLELHPDIAALSPFAKILHDLHGINGYMHSISRMIISYI
jgi:hypothetical protein